jgi:hypothetical protein
MVPEIAGGMGEESWGLRSNEVQGMGHHYTRARTPRLMGKGVRSHLTDEQDLYRLLEHTDDLGLNKKPAEWESIYNQ